MTTATGSQNNTLLTVLIGGIVATLIWEAFARFGAPLWIGGPLEPAGLVKSVFNNGLGFPLSNLPVDPNISAQAIHLATGIIGYPIGYILIARPIANAILPALPWWLVAAIYGVALWVFALYFMAHLLAGFPAFLNFQPISWASLVGHVLYALGLGAIVTSRT